MACIKGRGVPGAGRGPPKVFRTTGAGPPGRHPPPRWNGLQWPPEQRRSVCFATEDQRGTCPELPRAEASGCGLGRGGLRCRVLSATEPRPVPAPAAGFLSEGVARRVLAQPRNGGFYSIVRAVFARFPRATFRRAPFALACWGARLARVGVSWGEVELVYISSICRLYVVYKASCKAHFGPFLGLF